MAITRPFADAKEFSVYVEAVMGGLSRAPATAGCSGAIDSTLAMSSLLYVAAAMMEAHPALAKDSAIPAAVGGTVKQLTRYVEQIRASFRQTGEHVWDVLNVLPEHRH